MSKIHKEYLNGNAIAFGKDSDHVKVRAILATGIVPRVDNFGPLHADRKIKADEIRIVDNYELHIVHVPEAIGFSLGSDGGSLTTAKNVNCMVSKNKID